MILAAPLAPFLQMIWKKELPYVGWPTAWVAGAGLLACLVAAFVAGDHYAAAIVVACPLLVIFFIPLTGAYVLLWKAGDAWLGDVSAPKIRRRWAFAIVTAAVCGVWIPYIAGAFIADTCLDRGGAMATRWICQY